MFECRITKYAPQFRKPTGEYTRHEWTAYSDVGRVYNGVKLTLDEYLRVEEAHLDAAEAFLREAQVPSLTVRGLENALQQQMPLHDGDQLAVHQIREPLRNVLREEFWCRFEGDNSYIHIGWDYCVPQSCPHARGLAEKLGLFVEEMPSPHNRIDSEETE